MDRLRTMEVFCKVVDLGSFVAAAETLNMSRPMASKHVLRLEDELGVRLLNRTTRTVSPTEAGQIYYRKAQTIFAAVEDAVTEVSNLQTAPKGRLRINAPLSFGELHLTQAIASFQDTYPGITVDLDLNDRLVDIVDEGFDLAVRIGELQDSSLVATRLAPCRLVACASPSYLDMRGRPTSPKDLEEHNCLIYAYLAQQAVWRFEQEKDTTTVGVSGDFRSTFGGAVYAAAIAGRGICLEPSFVVGEALRDGRLEAVLTDWSPRLLGIYAVFPQARLLPRKVRLFIDHLKNTFGPDPTWDRGLF